MDLLVNKRSIFERKDLLKLVNGGISMIFLKRPNAQRTANAHENAQETNAREKSQQLEKKHCTTHKTDPLYHKTTIF